MLNRLYVPSMWQVLYLYLTMSISGCPGTVTLGVTEIPARREKITFNGLKITSQDFNSMYKKYREQLVNVNIGTHSSELP